MTVFAILAYPGIEPIYIGATHGVLSMATRVTSDLSFHVLSKAGGEVAMANGLSILANHGFGDAPTADILMVLGGPGWSEAAEDPRILSYIRAFHADGGTVAAVCTGGMILAAAGVLDGGPATTKREIVAGEARPLDLLGQRYGAVEVVEARFVDRGRVLTGGGVSLGIDMTLHLIERVAGARAARETARILEYATAWEANRAAFPGLVV